MDKGYEAGMSPRKRMASGDKDPFAVGDYGVAHLDSHSAGGPGGETDKGYLPDRKRGAAGPIGGNQANPDHGPHGRGSKLEV